MMMLTSSLQSLGGSCCDVVVRVILGGEGMGAGKVPLHPEPGQHRRCRLGGEGVVASVLLHLEMGLGVSQLLRLEGVKAVCFGLLLRRVLGLKEIQSRPQGCRAVVF